MGTNDQNGNTSPDTGPLDRLWRGAALPMLPLGLAMWAVGIGLNAYWVIVGGTITIALGAYKVTDR